MELWFSLQISFWMCAAGHLICAKVHEASLVESPHSTSRVAVDQSNMAHPNVNVLASRQQPLHMDPSVQLLSNYLTLRVGQLERGQTISPALVGQMKDLVNQEPKGRHCND